MEMLPTLETAIDPGGDLDAAMAVILSVIGLCWENMAYTWLYQRSMRWYRRRYDEGRTACRPGKAQGIVGMIWGGIFVLIGLFAAIPVFGLFGIVWTLCAAAAAGMHAYQLFIKRRAGPEIRIGGEEEAAGGGEAPSGARRRLEQLENLRKAGLIDGEEYRERRREILRRP